MDARAGEAEEAAVVLEGGHDPVLRLDRGEPGEVRVLGELERGVVCRPEPGPQGPGLFPELPGGLGVAGVVGLEGDPEQLAVSGGEIGGGFPDQVGWPRADKRFSVAVSAGSTGE